MSFPQLRSFMLGSAMYLSCAIVRTLHAVVTEVLLVSLLINFYALTVVIVVTMSMVLKLVVVLLLLLRLTQLLKSSCLVHFS
jgi:hypothetical protein